MCIRDRLFGEETEPSTVYDAEGKVSSVSIYLAGAEAGPYAEPVSYTHLVFNLSQLGELCRIADEDYKAAHPELPWHEMYGLRNRIVHDLSLIHI